MTKKCFLGLKHVWVFIATNVFFRKMFNRHADQNFFFTLIAGLVNPHVHRLGINFKVNK